MAFKITDSKDFVWINPSEIDCDSFDVLVTVGAGMPKNRASVYQIVTELYRQKLITAGEARKFICTQLSLPFSPELTEEI